MPRGEGRRIAHTKSRLGCQRCKARKVKCDEVHPRCSNCVKYETNCQYPSGSSAAGNHGAAPLPTNHLSPPAAMSEGSSRQSTTPPLANAAQLETIGPTRSPDSIVELQLMHHYSTVTSQGPFLGNHDPGIKDIYIRLAPVLAFKNPCLMDGIMAAAALHIYKLDPEKTTFRDLSRKYFNAAVIGQRRAVGELSSDNADALCIAASLIAFPALTAPQEDVRYSPPSLWLDLTGGHPMLYNSAWKWINESNRVMPIVNAAPNLQKFRAQCWQEYPFDFSDNLQEIFNAILAFQDPSEDLDLEQIKACKWCMAFVGHSLTLIEDQQDPSQIRRLLSSFGAMSPPVYKTMVRERRPRALVILAHLFTLYKAVDGVWWLRGIAEREVFGVQSILPERWHWAMVWPIQKLASYAVAAITPRQETVIPS